MGPAEPAHGDASPDASPPNDELELFHCVNRVSNYDPASRTGTAAPDSRPTRRLLEEPFRVWIDTMLDPFAACEASRDDRGLIVFDNGDRLWLYGNAVPLRNADGTPRGAIAAFVDISQYKRAEQELRVALEGKDQFLATISHELRTPLTAVMGYAQMLQQGVIAPGRQRHVVETISRNAALQLQLIDDILDVSGIIRGKVVLDRRPVDLTVVLETAITTILPTAERKRLHVSREFAPGHWSVDGDERRLHQVFGNALTNSVKFTPEGGRIHVALHPLGDACEVRIIDTGIGISAEFLPRVFERFTQEEAGTTREHGGLGIAHYLVTRHGGTISAHGDGPGHGSTVRVVLPRADAR